MKREPEEGVLVGWEVREGGIKNTPLHSAEGC